MQEERTLDSCPKALSIFIVFLCLQPCALSDCCSVRPAQKHSPPIVWRPPVGSLRHSTWRQRRRRDPPLEHRRTLRHMKTKLPRRKSTELIATTSPSTPLRMDSTKSTCSTSASRPKTLRRCEESTLAWKKHEGPSIRPWRHGLRSHKW